MIHTYKDFRVRWDTNSQRWRSYAPYPDNGGTEWIYCWSSNTRKGAYALIDHMYRFRIPLYCMEGEDHVHETRFHDRPNVDRNFFRGRVAVGTTAIEDCAAFQVDSTTKGGLLPRMTTAQRNAISSPAEGLLVYDTDLHKYCFHNGTAWRQINDSEIT